MAHAAEDENTPDQASASYLSANQGVVANGRLSTVVMVTAENSHQPRYQKNRVDSTTELRVPLRPLWTWRTVEKSVSIIAGRFIVENFGLFVGSVAIPFASWLTMELLRSRRQSSAADLTMLLLGSDILVLSNLSTFQRLVVDDTMRANLALVFGLFVLLNLLATIAAVTHVEGAAQISVVRGVAVLRLPLIRRVLSWVVATTLMVLQMGVFLVRIVEG